MKKITKLVFSLLLSISVSAQLPVSQITTNKNVVLEELTGKDCIYCPDGHKRADELKKNNPGRVVLLSIHTGGFASGTPNYKTSWGESLRTRFPANGYPSGAINRTNFGDDVMHSRLDWVTNATNIMRQSSPVNVAANANIDISNRQITVDVEAYYTANGPGNSNKIHVVLLQNNIAGPQAWASSNPSAVLPNGDYNHMHMVRHAISPTFGDPIPNISSGDLFAKSYNYIIPESYNNIAVKLVDLEVIVFISEEDSRGNIITGDYAAMNFVSPNGFFNLDGSVSEAHSHSNLCEESFIPKATYTNNSTTTAIDTFEISYTFNGGGTITEVFNGTQNIPPGGSYTHSFPAVNLLAGSNIVSYAVSNGSSKQKIDIDYHNDNTQKLKINFIPPTSIGANYVWDFENHNDLDEFWYNAVDSKSENSIVYVSNKNFFHQNNDTFGGYAQSESSFYQHLRSMEKGEKNEFITYKFDLSNGNIPSLTFDYAYGQTSSNSNDRFEIFATTDCGVNWTSVFNESGNSFATRPPKANHTGFIPTSGDWKTEVIDLSAFNKTDVMLKFVLTSDSGGIGFYLDNIRVQNITTGTEFIEGQHSFIVFPNPSNDVTTISFELEKSSNVKMTILNNLSRIVQNSEVKKMSAGQHKVCFNGNKFPKGIYFVNLIIDSTVLTKKIILN